MTHRRNLVAQPGNGRSLWRAIAKPARDQVGFIHYFSRCVLNNTKKGFSFQPVGQAMAEFAIVLPLLLLVVFGLLEVGRAIFIYSSATNASREAVRYATAFGVDPGGDLHYHNCAGIRDAARSTAILLTLADDDIVIEYDEGLVLDDNGTPGDTTDDSYSKGASRGLCDDAADMADGTTDGVASNISLGCGDRVVVTVTVDYSPMVNFIPQLQGREIVSASARSYYGRIDLTDDFTADECGMTP